MYSSVDGNLDFHLLPIVNRAARNIHGQIICLSPILLGLHTLVYPLVELLGPTVTLFNFLRNCQTSVAVPFYIPTSEV